VAKAAAKNEPVKQDIAVTVTADKIECAINGTVVGSYTKADLVAAGKRKSTDGVFGLRIAHNTEPRRTSSPPANGSSPTAYSACASRTTLRRR